MDRHFSNHTVDAVPAFTVPLTDEHLIALGRLTAIWSQIDFLIDYAIERVFDLSPTARDTLVGERMVGTKLKLLEKGCQTLDDDHLRVLVERFATMAGAIKNKRNHACHGLWAWRTSHLAKRVHVCARQSKSPGVPFKPSELPTLVREAAKCAQAGADVLAKFSPDGIAQPAVMYHGKEEQPPPLLETRSPLSRTSRQSPG